MLRDQVFAALLLIGLVAAKPVVVEDNAVLKKAQAGFGKVRRDHMGSPPVYCEQSGGAALAFQLVSKLPDSGSCSFLDGGCTQYACTTSDGTANTLSICGFGGSGDMVAPCMQLKNQATSVGKECTSSEKTNLLSFTGGTYEQGPDSLGFGYNVTITKTTGGCNNPRYT